MKKFEKPEIMIEKLELADVITTSGSCDLHGKDCATDMGMG